MRRPSHSWGKVILLVGFATVFASFSIRSGFGILLPEIIGTLALTKTQGGYIGSAYFAAYMVFAPLLGILTDRIGGRKVITLFLAVMAAGTLLMGTITSFWMAIVFHSIVGVGAAASWAPVSALIQKWFGIKRRGRALGVLTTGSYLGSAIIGLILPKLLLGFGWRLSWYLLGTIALALVPFNGLLLRSNPENASDDDQKDISNRETSGPQMSYREILKTSKFWLIGTSYLALSFSTNVVYVFLVTYATEELKMAYASASLLVTVQGLSGIAGALIFSTLSDRFGRIKTLVSINFMLAFIFLGVLLVGSNVFLLTLVLVAFGVFSAGTWPVYASCATDYFSKSVAGAVIGLWTTLYGIGSTISPPIAGYLADLYGTFFFSFAMSSMMAVIATLLIFQVKD